MNFEEAMTSMVGADAEYSWNVVKTLREKHDELRLKVEQRIAHYEKLFISSKQSFEQMKTFAAWSQYQAMMVTLMALLSQARELGYLGPESRWEELALLHRTIYDDIPPRVIPMGD